MKTISFKVTDEERRLLRRLAEAERLTVSEFLRRRIRGFYPCEPVSKTRCAFTGAEIFAPLAGQPPLTTEEVRSLLADFP